MFFLKHFDKSFKILSVLFFGIVLFIIIASIFYAQSIEKLNRNKFHTWKMKMEFLLHEMDLWEIILGKLLSLEVEFGKIVLEGNILNTTCS